ncbi:WD40-repeat-containing domain protein [Peziza echinospora]|nr:WD40-repeat-containing domain protein [Peziza echinospora]
MTIDDPVQYSSLILPSPLSFYHAKIPDKHWQLRSLLCSPAQDILFYPTGNNIYSLNTATRRRVLVASLPFAPICLGAKYGWVCAGGSDNGKFAAIRVGDDGRPLPARNGCEEARADVRVSELGGLIVNSITLHRPPGPNADQDILAILTNNDQTVRILSLVHNRVQTTLHLPIPTNHASISPDGKNLVVVGDSTEVYFYHSSSETAPNREAGRESWTFSSDTPLTAGTMPALISTSFSPSSVMCAVASQDGSITIFDTRYLNSRTRKGNCAIIKTIPSSRPQTFAGAVRSVQFSPAPWDLLVWAEHSGRISIADSRSNFNKRQIIDVLGEEKAPNVVEVLGVSDDDGCQSGRISGQRSRTGTETGGPIEDALNDEMENYFRGQIVGRTTNQNTNTLLNHVHTQGTTAPINYMHPRYFMRNTSAVATAVVSLPSTISPNAGTAREDTPHSVSVSLSLLHNHRERQLAARERDRIRQLMAEIPLRRTQSIEQVAFNPTPPATTTIIPPTINRDPQAPSQSATTRPAHWRVDYEAQRRPIEEIHQLQRNNEQLSLMIAEDRRRRRSSQNEALVTRVVPLLPVAANPRVPETTEHDAADGDGDDVVNITGCTLSVDGSKLYVATHKGIVEYKIDISERKVFPCMKMR